MVTKIIKLYFSLLWELFKFAAVVFIILLVVRLLLPGEAGGIYLQ